MKKLIFLGLIFISAKVFSQDAHQSLMQNMTSRLSFGLKAGANYSDYMNASFATDPWYGFHAGMTIGFRLTKHFSIVEDFLYAQEEIKNKSALFDGQNIKVSYLSVPILFRYTTAPGFYIEAGTQASMRLSEKVADLPPNAHFANFTNIGLAGGIGYQGKKGFGFGVRYIYGLTKAGDLQNTGINNNFKSGTAQVSLTYIF